MRRDTASGKGREHPSVRQQATCRAVLSARSMVSSAATGGLAFAGGICGRVALLTGASRNRHRATGPAQLLSPLAHCMFAPPRGLVLAGEPPEDRREDDGECRDQQADDPAGSAQSAQDGPDYQPDGDDADDPDGHRFANYEASLS
jgi:hypothetical protein